MRKILLLLLLPLSAPSAIATKPIWRLETVTVSVTESYDEEVLRVLKEQGVGEVLSQIILAQAKHESGNFTSVIFEENWNPFGMKQARVRQNTAIGTNRGHAVYLSLYDAVLDYVYYMRARNIPFQGESVNSYVMILKSKGYFEDGYNNYARGVRKFHEELG